MDFNLLTLYTILCITAYGIFCRLCDSIDRRMDHEEVHEADISDIKPIHEDEDWTGSNQMGG